jgi:hypothetical protein
VDEIHTSHARKEGSWWIVQNDQEPGAVSQVAELSQAVDAQREAIAFILNRPAASIDVSLRVIES